MLPKPVFWGGTELLTASRNECSFIWQSCLSNVLANLDTVPWSEMQNAGFYNSERVFCYDSNYCNIKILFLFMRVILNPFCLLYFPAVLMLCPSISYSPTDKHMACISDATGNFWQQTSFLASGQRVVSKHVQFTQMAWPWR